ncbi:hypothetical protein [Sulfurimonas microaerophilic]|uniref:hypothetical protein n=1 Tax=Sulfurimonas microaerophilic TaxID=3058392 RepID=UPI0027150516|nr:hypothetical protein [Sulfurimonas sp. hsl 1-7]
MENNNNISTLLPRVICGIDTLYYFYESNDNYDNMFLDILDQLEDAKSRFDKREISYEYRDLKVSINNQVFEYNGKAQGFYWFTHIDDYFKVGFKDYMTNRALNDIQIQLLGIGIYTLGLKSILSYIDELFKEVSSGYRPITRVDLNIFVQSDLSWLTKDMFVSRKRRYTTHSKEVASKYKLQTLYIGKEPFLLRIYDKREELKSSKKKELMYEYFANHDFIENEAIFNVEFELHRKYLKTYNITTVDELLGKAEQLFSECMENIRLVDLSTISNNSIKSSNRYKAEMHPLWQHLKESYKLKDFLAVDTPLERIKRKSYTYTIEDAIKEHISLARKHYIHGGVVDEQFYEEVLQAFERTLKPKYEDIKISQTQSQELEIVYETVASEINITELTDLELEKYIKMIEVSMNEPDLDLHVLIKKHQLACIELESRGKHLQQEFPF